MRKRRLLIAYSYASTFVSTTRDYLDAFQLLSDWEVHYVHVTENAEMDFDFSSYDAIFHNYCARFCFDGYVSPSYSDAMRRFQGVKVLSVQDEYDFTGKVRHAAADIGFDIFLTCVPEESWEHVYPRAMFPQTDFIRVLTGYVPDGLDARGVAVRPLAERPSLIGYRGRDIGGRYGRLGFEKLEIGRRMAEICAARGLPVDIAFSEESRLYGGAWFEFLGSCRATLGSESGSNIFDFDGRIAAHFDARTKRLGRPPSYQEFEPYIRHLETAVDMGQISPRVFEATAMRTPMIMFEGRYADVVAPDVHYIPLRKDFSNIDHVLARLQDIPALEAMVDRAHADLVASGRYSYRSFVDQVARAIERRCAGRPGTSAGAAVTAQTPAMLEARLGRARPFVEQPTTVPLSRQWYLAAAHSRRYRSFTDDLAKLLGWARTEIASDAPLLGDRKRQHLTQIEQNRDRVTDQFAADIKQAYVLRDDQSMDDVTNRAKRGLDALAASIAMTTLDGKSWPAARAAALRAPWIDADVPALAWAKRLRERLARVRGMRRAWRATRRLVTSEPHGPAR